MPWRRGIGVSSRRAIEENGAMGREIESRTGYRLVALKALRKILIIKPLFFASGFSKKI
jgi:hypothetical protein